VTPEGTRARVSHWKTGFYHIALTAGVPLGMATIDYSKKEVRMVDYAIMTGDGTTDVSRIRDAYQDCRGLKPESAAPVTFSTEQRDSETTQRSRRA